MFAFNKRKFSELSDQEILALAISSEEEDMRIYAAYAAGLHSDYPSSAKVFNDMAAEENEHRERLIEVYRKRFGEVVLPIKREHVRGFPPRRPYWLSKSLSIEKVRQEAADMEAGAYNFYMKSMERTTDAETKKLLGSLAQAERGHESTAEKLTEEHVTPEAHEIEKETERRKFLLQVVQPGLAGLMDGSVSTLAPIFAAAFATQSTWNTFLVGLAASIGAGISMALTEAFSDDGELTGRGSPLIRGTAAGVMTALGGLGHALPYLIPHFWTATGIAAFVVFAELWIISWIRTKYMDTPFLQAAFQVVVGGMLVFAVGVLIGQG